LFRAGDRIRIEGSGLPRNVIPTDRDSFYNVTFTCRTVVACG
jgi:hypothetical protein